MPTTQNMIDKIRRAYYANYPDDSARLTDNEILLYLNDAIAKALTKQANEDYAVSGISQVPEGYISSYEFNSYEKDNDTGQYKVALPHPPYGVPNYNGVVGVYFKGSFGKSRPLLHVKPMEVDFFYTLPMPLGGFYWVEGNTLILWLKTDIPQGAKIVCRMPSIAANKQEQINVPPDALEFVFLSVMQLLQMRAGKAEYSVNDGKEKS